MYVVAFNGSPRKTGNTSMLLRRCLDILEKEGLTDQERTMQIRYIIYTLEAEGVSIQNR